MHPARPALALACLATWACAEAVTETLSTNDATIGRGDGGSPEDARPDAAARPDAGPDRDAAPNRDAVPDRDADGTPDFGILDAGSACNVGPIDVALSAARGPGGIERRVSGRARIESWFPDLILAFESGERLEVTGRITGAPWPAPLLSTIVQADALVRQPFWTEVSLHLRSLPGVQPFPLEQFTVWSQAGLTVPVGDERLSYIPSMCLDTSDRCGATAPLHLSAVLADGSALFVPPGERVEQGRFTAVNGRSRQFIGEVRCGDVPREWTAGYLVDRGF